MQNKAIKILAFILYTWIIYQSFVIFSVLVSFCFGKYNFNLNSLLDVALYLLNGIFLEPIQFFTIFFRDLFHWDSMLFCATIIAINIASMIYWCRRQTIERAWLIAFTCTVVGTGAQLWIDNVIWPRDTIALITLILINLFFFILLIVNFLQRKYWPNNRFANRIRAILKWPCLKV